MSHAPLVFDRALVRRRQKRALAQGAQDFLLAAAVEELLARLSAAQRDFVRALDLGGPSPMLAAGLAKPGRTVLRMSDDPAFAGAGPFVLGDEEALPVDPAAFDLIASALTLQWVNDLPGAFAQIRRALAPDGLFLACLIGGESLSELRASFMQAESELEDGASPRVAPFVDVRTLGA
ncbi:MAG: methyltransferase domain-containing protein, partial [Rhodoblastus sp.]